MSRSDEAMTTSSDAQLEGLLSLVGRAQEIVPAHYVNWHHTARDVIAITPPNANAEGLPEGMVEAARRVQQRVGEWDGLQGHEPRDRFAAFGENLRHDAIALVVEVLAASPTPTKAATAEGQGELEEALEQTRALIQEAKGADGPDGGFVTDHLDFAESWLDKVEQLSADRQAAVADVVETLRRTADALECQVGREPEKHEWHPDHSLCIAWRAISAARATLAKHSAA